MAQRTDPAPTPLRTMRDGLLNTDYEAVVEEERLILDATELVCELMEAEEVNKTELAARLGKTKGFVSQLLNGKRNMTLRTFSDLLRVLGYRARFQVEPIAPRS